MYVIKRDGKQESVHFDKITARLKKLSYGLNPEHCDPVLVAQKVCMGVYKGVTTSQLDELAAETAAAMTTNHPDYAIVISFPPFFFLLFFSSWLWLLISPASGCLVSSFFVGSRCAACLVLYLYPILLVCVQLAARIAVSNLHKNTKKSFSETYAFCPTSLQLSVLSNAWLKLCLSDTFSFYIC